MDNSSANPGSATNAQMRSDEQLMVAFAGGSTDAFDELFSRYKQPLFGFFRRRVDDPAQAEELTQDAFVAVIRASGRYQERALFRTYLYAIGLRMLIGYRRKMAFSAMFQGVAAPHHEPADESHLEADLSLRQALEKLDRMDREVLMLREYEELSYAEIGEVLALPINTIRSRLFRARVALRELLTSPAVAPSVSELSNTRLARFEEGV